MIPSSLRIGTVFISVLLIVSRSGYTAEHASPAKADKQDKPVAGKADVLRHVPKKFAVLLEAHPARGEVRLLVDGEKEPKTWTVNPDAEIKVHGWWGRLEQFDKGDRVWVWFDIDRKKQPVSILMLADEISEQDIHGSITDEPALEHKRQAQRDRMRTIWRKEGLPGTVTFLHKLSGEMEVTLDHEAIRWGRHLKYGDKVTLRTATPIQAAVRSVKPWRERTQVRLVTNSGRDQADLALGQRVRVAVPEPPAEIQSSNLPTDLGRSRTNDERIEWFLASTYCSCRIAGDRCTGMFYTLASCNVNGCGMPDQVRSRVSAMIDKGLSDQQILDELVESHGPLVLRPHLLK